ncbi:hypothetical protein DSO57_1015767, partial [Entomophthora muscae]
KEIIAKSGKPELNASDTFLVTIERMMSHQCDSNSDPSIDSTNKQIAACPLESKPKSLGAASLQVFGPKSGTK